MCKKSSVVKKSELATRSDNAHPFTFLLRNCPAPFPVSSCFCNGGNKHPSSSSSHSHLSWNTPDVFALSFYFHLFSVLAEEPDLVLLLRSLCAVLNETFQSESCVNVVMFAFIQHLEKIPQRPAEMKWGDTWWWWTEVHEEKCSVRIMTLEICIWILPCVQ